MGKRARLQPRYGNVTYEAKLRRPGDRVNGSGDKVEGGKIFSRHFSANNPGHAEGVARRIAKKLNSKVVSIAKVHAEDIIGDFRSWNLKDIIGKPIPERKKDVILDDVTLDDIVYNRRK